MIATLFLIALAFFYCRGWFRLRSTQPHLLAVGKLIVFMAGVVSMWAAVASPLAGLDHQLLTAHMAQHIVIMNVAAPLILLGAPLMALMHGFPPAFMRSVVGPLLQSSPAQRFGVVITHSVFCWLASTVVVIGWHVPVFFELGMRSAGWHQFEYASFLAAGLLFWWPVVQPWPCLERWPRWHIPLYLFLATLPCDALSAFLAFCNRVAYSHYQAAVPRFGLSSLGDQQCAGALMWICVTFAYLIPAVVVTIELISSETSTAQVEMN